MMKTYQYMQRMMAYRPLLYLFDNLTWIALTIVELAPGFLSKLFFDTLTGDQPYRFGVTGVVILVLVSELVHLVLIATGATLDTHHRFRMSALLRRNMLSHVLKRPGARAIPGSTGEALNTFRDDAQEIENILSWSIDQSCIISFSIVALVSMMRINPRITFITTLPLIAVIIIARLTGTYVSQYRQLSRRSTEMVTGALGEVLNSVQAIQVANAAGPVLDHLQSLNDERRRLVIKDRLLTQILDSIYRNAGALGTGLILILVAESMKSISFSMGDFALFVYNLELLTEFFTDFGDYLAHIKQAGVSFERMTSFIRNQPPELPESKAAGILVAHHPVYVQGTLPVLKTPTSSPGSQLRSLELKNLTYHYPGKCQEGNGLHGIEGIDLQVKQGDFVVITGRIGSGKTTLLQVLLGLLPAGGGEIWWNGTVVEDPAAFFVPPRAAYTAQIPHLFSETLANNILMGLPDTDNSLDKAIYRAVLEDDIAQLPDGVDTLVGTRGVKLSGGQRQRVAAARMFVRNPEILVFDDLSSALDVRTEHLLWKRVFSESNDSRKPTCLVVSHRHMALNQADQIVVLKDGRIAASGIVESLLQTSPEFRYIWGVADNGYLNNPTQCVV
ncbi:MAG: ABC transporter ATP-binding protein [Anaerolineae bacterium]|nr:ABC transporter ATP-binding protein [Anaerolineae bacterium]